MAKKRKNQYKPVKKGKAGAIWGGILAFKRLIKCNPKSKGGVDFPKLNLLGNYKWKC